MSIRLMRTHLARILVDEQSKALHSKLFSVKALLARLRKLMELMKRLIAIIIVNFVIAKINGN